MKISELSRRADVAVPTIKYYLREGLLPAGEKSGANQSAYDEGHVARLRLIRSLLDVGGLSVASTRAVLAALDDDGLAVGYVFEVASQALPVTVPPPVAETTPGVRRIDEIIAARGWHVSRGNPGRAIAARVLDDYVALGRDDLTSTVDVYADAAELVARADLGTVAAAADRAAMTQTVVIGTVLGDALFTGLRRVAHEDAAMRRFPPPPGSIDPHSTTHPEESRS